MRTVIVLRTMDRGTWREIYGGLAEFAHGEGWNLQQVEARAGIPAFRALFDFWQPAGVIASTAPESLLGTPFEELPMVFLNATEAVAGRKRASVASDTKEIVRLAMGELLRLHPVSLGYVGWFRPTIWSPARRREAERIAALHGLTLRAIATVEKGESSMVEHIERIAEALKTMPRPIGLMAASDDVGALALAAAARLGLAVPDDVAVAGVDDDPEVCENCTPTLTSVRPDYQRLGREAAAALKRLMDGERGPLRTVVPLMGLIRRASTVSLMRRDANVAEALERIRRHACDGLRTSQVVAGFGTSLRTAETRFKAATGRTIGQEILERRFEAACAYLREGTASIGAIADFCGWNGDIAFRKAFKERFGLPPLKWARQEALKRRAHAGTTRPRGG